MVKKAKEQFDKLKGDVTEKISMLNASRCSLLSRSLPSYQEAALQFFENASQELETVLTDFRSRHHHQYRIKSEDVQDEEDSSERPTSSLDDHASDSEDDDVENNQPLLDLAASNEDQATQTKDQESFNYANSSYQAVDTFSQLKVVCMESTDKQATLQPGTDSLALPIDDAGWSKLLLSSSIQPATATDRTTTDLSVLKIDHSVPLISTPISSTVTSHITPTTSSSTASVLHSLQDHTSSPKLHDNWDELFADLDPLSNEKV